MSAFETLSQDIALINTVRSNTLKEVAYYLDMRSDSLEISVNAVLAIRDLADEIRRMAQAL